MGLGVLYEKILRWHKPNADGNDRYPSVQESSPLPVRVYDGLGNAVIGTGASAQQIQGTAADGAPAVGKPVQVGGVDGSENARRLRLDGNGRVPFVFVSTLSADGQGTPAGVAVEDNTTPRALATLTYCYNGSNLDRWRANVEATAFASAARTTSQNGADITTYNARGLIVVVNTSLVPGSAPSNVVTIQGKDALSGVYYDLLASAAITGVGTVVLQVSPELTDSPNLVKKQLLPRVIRVVITAGNANSATYSVGYVLTV